MNALKGRSECENCQVFQWFEQRRTLSSIRKSANGGCLECKLLSESAGLFRDKWLHLEKEEEELVHIVVSENFATLIWPSQTENSEDEKKLEIQITLEEAGPILDSPSRTSRVVAFSSAAAECIDFIQSKLAFCDEKHEDCRMKPGKDVVWPKRLLKIDVSGDVLKVVLVGPSDTSQEYIALSHCWGTSKDGQQTTSTVPPKTNTTDLENYKSAGISESSLTKTFRDALDITRKLGVEYIWIDSLCIVQDDEEDWRIESRKMGSIYGNAYLVIAATLAKDGDHGLYCERAQRRIEFQTSAGEQVKAAVFLKAHHDIWKKGEQFWDVQDLPLFDRAWAFQERLLARRVVHYTPTELVWECSCSIDCECGDLQNPNTSWAEFKPGKNLKTKYSDVLVDSNMARLKFWHDICAQYSARQLTFPSDRRPALSSVARRIDFPGMGGAYLAGIWRDSLPHGQFWWSEFTNPKLYPLGAKTHRRDKSHKIPTWSWLSIGGRVSTWGISQACLIVVEILNVHYIPAMDGDDYGPCGEGIITLRSPGAPIEVAESKLPDGPSNKEVQLVGNQNSYDFYADENPFEHPAQNLKDSQLLAFLFGYSPSHSQVFILKLVPGTSKRYERLGIANLCPHEWFAGQTARVIELV